MSRDILSRAAPAPGLRLAYGADPAQFGDLGLPDGAGPHPTVVVVHGGFWRARFNLEYMGHLCLALREEGLATWNLEYRRVGQAGGGWPGTLLDVAQGTDYLRQLAPRYNLDLARVVSVGHSAGGHLALWLGARPRLPRGAPLWTERPQPLAGAISLAGVTDLEAAYARDLGDGAARDFLGGCPRELPDRYALSSPAALLPLGLPQLLIHGTEDESVPHDLSTTYAEVARRAGDRARTISLPGYDHFAVVDPRSAAWPGIRDWLIAFPAIERLE